MTTHEKMLKARTMLVLDHPFFGCLALKLKLVESDEYKTCTTDGKYIFYNPTFIDRLSNQEVAGVLAHEVMHLALGHHWRQDNRDAKDWNNATDYTINYNLRDTGFVLPGLDDIHNYGAYKDLSAEEIYTKISKPKMPKEEPDKGKQKKDDKQKGQNQGQGQGHGQDKQKEKQQKPDKKKEPQKPDNKKQQQDKQNQQGQGQGQGQEQEKQQQDIDPGGCGAVIPPEGKEQTTKSKAEWKAAVTQALQVARGKLPADLERQVKEILETHVPWHILLRDFIERTARNDYSWSKPNPRYFSTGIILPSLISEEIPEIAIAIDTSCSITKEQLSEFASEASAVLGAYETTIRVIYCDAKIQGEEVFTKTDLPLKLKLKGGGGTRFAPVFEHIEEQQYAPSCLIYFTDLAGSFPEQEPEYPTMWLVPDVKNQYERKAPFGITVKF